MKRVFTGSHKEVWLFDETENTVFKTAGAFLSEMHCRSEDDVNDEARSFIVDTMPKVIKWNLNVDVSRYNIMSIICDYADYFDSDGEYNRIPVGIIREIEVNGVEPDDENWDGVTLPEITHKDTLIYEA